MEVKYIRIFADELVVLEKVDGTIINCVMQSSKNDFDLLQNLTSDIQDLHEIVITIKLEGNKRLDFPVKIKDILSLERKV